MSKDKSKPPSNVVPLIKDKRTRDIVKGQFDSPPGDKIQERLDKINQKMAELRQMAERQSGLEAYGEKAGYYPEAGGGGSEAVVTTPEQASTLPRPEELEREYRRKQDEMRKQRENRNRTVASSYRLHGKGEKPRK